MLLTSDSLYTWFILGRLMIQYIILLITYTWYMCYFVELLLLIFGFPYRFLILLLWRQLKLYNLILQWRRYRVYMWGFSYLDYSFDVLISRIGNVGLYNWFHHSYFTYCLISCSYVLYSWYTFHVHVCLICMPLGLISCTRWVTSDSTRPVCPDFRARILVALLKLIRMHSGSFHGDRSAAEVRTSL